MECGALAVAAGAAIGGAAPSTRIEDRYMGRYRDDLMDEADRIFHEEMGKARAVGSAASDEARKIYDEKRQDAQGAMSRAEAGVRDAAEQARTEAESAADRIGGAAKAEAKKQDFGHVG